MSTLRSVIRAAALAGALVSATVASPVGLSPASAQGLIVLGAPMDQYSVGYGTTRPATLSMSSMCANTITDVVWDSWGGPVAHGTGAWCQSAGESDRGEPVRQVSLTASGMGICQGKLAYRTLQYDSQAPSSICQR